MGTNTNKTMVALLRDELPEELRSYYNSKVLTDKIFIGCIIREIRNPQINLKTFEDKESLLELISYYLYTLNEKDNSPKDALSKIKEKKRQMKRQLYKKIREEQGEYPLSARNPHFLEEDCNVYSFAIKTNTDSEYKKFKTVEDYRQYKYNCVKAWHDNSQEPCIKYEYFDGLKVDVKARAFLTDLEFYIYSYICEELHSNQHDGYLTKLPEKILEAPYFTYRKTNMEIKVEEDEENKTVEAFESYSHGKFNIKTTVKSIPVINEESTKLIEQLESTYVLSKNVKNLDTEDMEILAIICSYITGENIKTGKLSLALKDVFQNFYGTDKKLRSKEYKIVLQRIEKLARYTLEMSYYDKDRSMVEHSILHFFDAKFYMPVKEGNKEETINEYELQDIDNFLNNYDLGKTIISINLGDTIKEAWNTSKVMMVCSNIYDNLDNSKARALLFILEEMRIQAHPETEGKISVNDICNKIRFPKKEKIKKEISSIMDIFLEKDSIIESYKFDKSNIILKFKPLTQFELSAYNLIPNIETCGVVDI